MQNLRNVKINKAERKWWSDPEALNEKILSSEQARGYKHKMSHLFKKNLIKKEIVK